MKGGKKRCIQGKSAGKERKNNKDEVVRERGTSSIRSRGESSVLVYTYVRGGAEGVYGAREEPLITNKGSSSASTTYKEYGTEKYEGQAGAIER